MPPCRDPGRGAAPATSRGAAGAASGLTRRVTRPVRPIKPKPVEAPGSAGGCRAMTAPPPSNRSRTGTVPPRPRRPDRQPWRQRPHAVDRARGGQAGRPLGPPPRSRAPLRRPADDRAEPRGVPRAERGRQPAERPAARGPAVVRRRALQLGRHQGHVRHALQLRPQTARSTVAFNVGSGNLGTPRLFGGMRVRRAMPLATSRDENARSAFPACGVHDGFERSASPVAATEMRSLGAVAGGPGVEAGRSPPLRGRGSRRAPRSTPTRPAGRAPSRTAAAGGGRIARHLRGDSAPA